MNSRNHQPDPDYTFRTVNAEQRHLVPGMYATLFADDVFSPDIRSELIHTRVLKAFDDGQYLAEVIEAAHLFHELPENQLVTFTLNQVAHGARRQLYCLEA